MGRRGVIMRVDPRFAKTTKEFTLKNGLSLTQATRRFEKLISTDTKRKKLMDIEF